MVFMGHRQTVAPDVTPQKAASQNVASHLGLFCLLEEFHGKIK